MKLDPNVATVLFVGAVVFVGSLGCALESTGGGGDIRGDRDDCEFFFDNEDNCECTLDEDGTVIDGCINGATDEGGSCTCDLVDPEPEPEPEPDPEPEPPVAFRFVLVEDLTANPSGDFPGADVDAISVVKASGDEIFAETFEEDTDIDCENNLSCDISALLGAPDAVDDGGTCFGGAAPQDSAALFTSMNGGHVIVQFSSVANGDVTIENGDAIHVYEIGATECGRFDDDPFKVSVSVADDITGDFKEVGEGGTGDNIVPVTGLP